MRKKHFKPREDHFVSIVLFLGDATPRTCLIPSEAWLNGANPVLVSRDDPDAASEPEWGVKLSAKGMVHLEPFEIQRIAGGMAGGVELPDRRERTCRRDCYEKKGKQDPDGTVAWTGERYG
jgi:hypothetical protein